MENETKSVKYLESNATELLRQINSSRRPVIITQNGKAKAVIQDAESYENMRNAIGLLKLLALGEEDINKGRVMDQETVFTALDKKLQNI